MLSRERGKKSFIAGYCSADYTTGDMGDAHLQLWQEEDKILIPIEKSFDYPYDTGQVFINPTFNDVADGSTTDNSATDSSTSDSSTNDDSTTDGNPTNFSIALILFGVITMVVITAFLIRSKNSTDPSYEKSPKMTTTITSTMEIDRMIRNIDKSFQDWDETGEKSKS